MNFQPPALDPSACQAAARAARQREVETALLVQALCGQPPSPDALARLRRYEAGELPREQAFMALYEGLL
ncbi:hypothetical protein GCM10023172_28100 [Hymenobacter ginsengisoli]|uniref:Antitoxin VbhA domain-containing protein n=1 Tax=Hymenobacter ginsengisoli TaxID=1051626 RepID=A0ABP8QIX4_9BACT|nr:MULTISPECIES: antitoxin VbhA family protein [unclassified Hymenobacter]MBO2029935.1 antitoxin VbhA family protein [Hymenobacter sp. BT559]